MKLHEHFLAKDLEQASKEFHCFKECLELTSLHVDDGNMILARQRGLDALNSLHILTNLAAKKDEADKRKLYMSRMGIEGNFIEMVRRLHYE